VLIFLIILLFAGVASVVLYKVNILEMSYQLMYPIVFMGSMAFMFSTIVKNGNGTAVVMVLIGVALIILADALERTQWNVFLNPFEIPNSMNQVIWQGIISKNRIFLGVAMLVFILYGLFNMQKREKFV
jgi:ABC-type transport system involved in multi-copper enzyme maturation permease subunit